MKREHQPSENQAALDTRPARGVVYFNYGHKCIERLLVSIHSLRKHYTGPVAVINVGPVDAGFGEILDKLEGVELVVAERIPYRALVNKVHSLQYTPFDLNVFLDADTLVVGPIDEFFDALDGPTGKEVTMEGYTVEGTPAPLTSAVASFKYGLSDRLPGGSVDFVWCNFCSWVTDGKQIKKRMDRWRDKGVVDEAWIDAAIKFGPAVNVGTFAYRRGAPWLREWMELTRRGGTKKLWIPDEQAAQICMPRIPCRILGPEWGVSVRYGDKVEDKRVIHYHGNKHDKSWPMCDLWRAARDELKGGQGGLHPNVVGRMEEVNKEFVDGLDPPEAYAFLRDVTILPAMASRTPEEEQLGEELVASMADELGVWNKLVIPDVKTPFPGLDPLGITRPPATGRATLVVAVNKPYLELFRRNYETWKNFRDVYPKLIIYNGIDPDELHGFLTGEYRLVEWGMEGVSPKEEMITSFVSCAPREVQTPFWIKLDVDTVCDDNAKLFASKKWYDHDLVSHRWGYTKPGKWLVTLEEWGDGAMPGTDRVFTAEELGRAAEQKRFGHPRIQSFACLHRTSFTQIAADLVGDGERMPVPSHDTFLWYVATRGGYSVCRTNIRRWGYHHGRKK